ncbi:MAG: sigma-70 family RNA polymerase sigma factor [Actinomycetota bacterium]|nr:sigma-70 family RNA polymerase sigma factor [Actinomycetota bacterium]
MADRQDRFRRIYDSNYERILGYALRRTDTFDDAHDVVSETFLVAWRRLDEVPHGERARLWLYGTARRVLANQYRGRRRQRRLTDQLLTEPHRLAGSTDESVAASEAEQIGAAFSRLADHDRELLLLVGWEGLSSDELAQTLGCSRATVRVRLHRARKRFAKELEKQGVKRSKSTGHEPSRWASARPDPEEAL